MPILYNLDIINDFFTRLACLKKVDSRFRSVTQKRNQGRFPVTHDYVNSPKRCVTVGFHGYARNRVTGCADPWVYIKLNLTRAKKASNPSQSFYLTN